MKSTPNKTDSKSILKELARGVPIEEVVEGNIYWPIVYMARDGGYLVAKRGETIFQHYTEEEFNRIKKYFKSILFMCQRDEEDSTLL